MADESGVTLTVEEFVEYCQTGAGLLWGQMQTMNDDVLAPLDEIDTEVTRAVGTSTWRIWRPDRRKFGRNRSAWRPTRPGFGG
jgi:hypothetical protein